MEKYAPTLKNKPAEANVSLIHATLISKVYIATNKPTKKIPTSL